MPDIMPVSMQDILYCWKSDLREQKVRYCNYNRTRGKGSGFYDRCLMHVRYRRNLYGE